MRMMKTCPHKGQSVWSYEKHFREILQFKALQFTQKYFPQQAVSLRFKT